MMSCEYNNLQIYIYQSTIGCVCIRACRHATQRIRNPVEIIKCRRRTNRRVADAENKIEKRFLFICSRSESQLVIGTCTLSQ